MPETGNNTTNKGKILSIRLSPNGLYFSISTGGNGKIDCKGIGTNPDTIANYLKDNNLLNSDIDKTEVSLNTGKMVLVPIEEFCESLSLSYLQINGHMPSDNQSAVTSQQTKGVVAVMAWESLVIDKLKECYGEKLGFSSPIMESIAKQQANSVQIARYGANVYIVIVNSALEYAQCLPYQSIADTIYYLETLKKEFVLDKHALYIYGEQAEATAKQLKRYYKSVTLGNKN